MTSFRRSRQLGRVEKVRRTKYFERDPSLGVRWFSPWDSLKSPKRHMQRESFGFRVSDRRAVHQESTRNPAKRELGCFQEQENSLSLTKKGFYLFSQLRTLVSAGVKASLFVSPGGRGLRVRCKFTSTDPSRSPETNKTNLFLLLQSPPPFRTTWQRWQRAKSSTPR